MNYAETLREHRRLGILQALAAAPGYGVHEYLLREQLRRLALAMSADGLRTELAWLAEQELIAVAEVEGAWVPQITQRGHDVAGGYAQVPGVARPAPR